MKIMHFNTETAFIEKKSSCGVRTGVKKNQIVKNTNFVSKHLFMKNKKAPAAYALASNKKIRIVYF